MSFWRELRRRKVFQVAAVYGVVAWLIVQIAAVVEAPLNLPDWFDTLVIVLLVAGFPVMLVTSWAFNVTSDGLVRDRGAPDAARQSSGRTLEYVLIGVLAAAVIWVLYRVELGEPVAARSAAGGDVLSNSIAVLLCDNFSTDPENDFFAASLHEELLNQLVKLRNLQVIARTSVLQYADAARPITEIARELRVESVMECSVAYGDGRIVISAQLIDGETGLHLWSDRYNRPLEDVFGVQADIAMNVANALLAEFSLTEQHAIEQVPTSSPAAYALYLQARGSMLGTALPFAQALELLDRAIEIDPGFAGAYGLKAMILAASFTNTAQGAGVAAEDRDALESRVREFAVAAQNLDPLNADARAALRVIDIPTWHWTAYEQAVEPRDEPRLLAAQLWIYAWMGQRDKAVRVAEQAADLNPNDAGPHLSLGVTYAYNGDRAASIRSLRRAQELAPADALVQAWLAYNEVALGNAERALTALRLTEQLLGDNRPVVYLPELAYSYSRLGRTDDVQRLAAELRALGDEQAVGAGTWAVAYLALGDEQRALELLDVVAEKARRHEPDQGYLNVMNLKMNYLADPRLERREFVAALGRISGD